MMSARKTLLVTDQFSSTLCQLQQWVQYVESANEELWRQVCTDDGDDFFTLQINGMEPSD